MSDLEKENTVKNTKNFIPYGTNHKKNKMVRIDDWKNRLKMATEGYSLDVLINDKDYYVRKAVLNYLKDNNLTLAEWCNQNNKEIDLKNLAYSPYPEARVAAIKSGYVYKKIEMYIHTAPDRKFIPYGTNPEKDKMVESNYWGDRLEMVKEGYGLDVLINDENKWVRATVARQGCGLNILINDEHWYVRAAIAEQGYYLNILINDKNWRVRTAVAEQGYGLDILINDEDCDVRTAIAKQGYGLDVLINDEDWKVREAVKNYLTSHNLTLEQWKSNQEHSKTDIINQAKNAINDGNIDIKNVADNIKSTKSILNDSINKTNKTNEIDKSI